VAIDAADPDADGWYRLTVAKSKGGAVLVWPYDGRAKTPDGPEPIPAIVIQAGDSRTPLSARVVAALAAGKLLGVNPEVAFDTAVLAGAEDPFAKGIGLLYAHKAAEAVEPLARALRERERQLTRVPSEIYPAAMLYARALFGANQFDDAAVAFLKAMKQRPADRAALNGRVEALIKAGKAEAAQALLDSVK
jgi:tetratricopeptide (TPR) repeat protein